MLTRKDLGAVAGILIWWSNEASAQAERLSESLTITGLAGGVLDPDGQSWKLGILKGLGPIGGALSLEEAANNVNNSENKRRAGGIELSEIGGNLLTAGLLTGQVTVPWVAVGAYVGGKVVRGGAQEVIEYLEKPERERQAAIRQQAKLINDRNFAAMSRFDEEKNRAAQLAVTKIQQDQIGDLRADLDRNLKFFDQQTARIQTHNKATEQNIGEMRRTLNEIRSLNATRLSVPSASVPVSAGIGMAPSSSVQPRPVSSGEVQQGVPEQRQTSALPEAQPGGVRNSTGPLPEGGQRIGAYADQPKSDGVGIGGGVAGRPGPTADRRAETSVAPQAPNATPSTGSRANVANAREPVGLRTEARDIGSDRRIGAFETSKPRDVATGASNQAATARTQDLLAGGVRTESQQPAERRIGAFADNPAFQRLRDEFKRPEMNPRATAQTGALPKTAMQVQTGIPEAYRQELAERARQQREEQERIRRANEEARRAAREEAWRNMNEAQRRANQHVNPTNPCQMDYNRVGALPPECYDQRPSATQRQANGGWACQQPDGEFLKDGNGTVVLIEGEQPSAYCPRWVWVDRENLGASNDDSQRFARCIALLSPNVRSNASLATAICNLKDVPLQALTR